MQITPRAFFLFALVLVGCPSAEDDRLPSCTVPDDLEVGTVTAEVDGEEWTGATAGYQLIAGPALQVSATGADGDGRTVNIVLRLLRASSFAVDEETDEVVRDDDQDIEDILRDKETPYDFALGDASEVGANATVTISPDPSMSTGEGDGDGFLRITSIAVPDDGEDGDPEELVGCFDLRAVTQNEDRGVDVVGGGFRLVAL